MNKTEEERKSKIFDYKIAIIGETEVGKTSLVRNYKDLKFTDPDFTTGIDLSNITIPIRDYKLNLSIWDLSGSAIDLISPTTNDSAAVLILFDLCELFTLQQIKLYLKESMKSNARNFFLVGCKFDLFVSENTSYIEQVTDLAKKVSERLEIPLVFCSAKKSVNVKKLFKLIICFKLGINCSLKERTKIGEPLFIFKKSLEARRQALKKLDEKLKEKKSTENENSADIENKSNEKENYEKNVKIGVDGQKKENSNSIN